MIEFSAGERLGFMLGVFFFVLGIPLVLLLT